MARQRQINLYKSYQQRVKAGKKRFDPLRSYFTLPVLLAVVGLGIWGILSWQNHQLSRQISEIDGWLKDPNTIGRYELSQQKQEQNRRVLVEKQEAEDLTLGLSTYPEIDSKVLDRIRRVGGDAVKITINGYDAATGVLSFVAQSAKVIDIPDYVLKLQKTDLFYSVDYTGYEYANNGEYVLHLGCLLLAPEGEVDVP